MKFLYTFLLIIVLSACHIAGDLESVDISLPEKADNLFSIAPTWWDINFRDDSGETVHISMSAEDQASVIIQFPKGLTRAVLIEAVFTPEEGREFRSRPAGFLYPYDCNGGRSGSFRWDEGFLCKVIYSSSEFISPDFINIPRLRDLIEEKAGGESKWALDFPALYEEIVTGELSYYDVRPLRFRDISIKLPAALWENSDITGLDIFSGGISELLSLSLPTGVNRFLGTTGQIAEIHIKTDGSMEYIVY